MKHKKEGRKKREKRKQKELDGGRQVIEKEGDQESRE